MTTQEKVTKGQAKLNALTAALVAAYGEGTVITLKQLQEVMKKNLSAYPHEVAIRKNPDYKVGRGQYVVTASKTPAVARDAARLTLDATAIQKEEKLLPKAVRTSPKKLAEILLKTPVVKTAKKQQTKVVKTQKPKVQKAKQEKVFLKHAEDNSFVSQDEIDESFGGNDINDILSSL